ncbi:uncharacterized protein F5891DRAFT_1281046 [Suillus fuscotomentosus]|uniref:GS catalytic domain-containing protein n=1 Tax=Suillus fuscotomentosus TaxID=1912939 RepID=A0AAD4HGT6_9AGAM|nr:uncharacterized protein F5891DRAFT_1281046 [Suillus fuscotomentosus]KAG1895691.1 hypothetical protein F5891DRAFT_1281046 [Suillus fuscotomentosus]
MHGYSLLRTQLNREYFYALFDESLKFGIDVEGHHTETGPSVLETGLAYTSAMRIADNAILYKFSAKNVGLKHEVLPSFMAKPWGNRVCIDISFYVQNFSDIGSDMYMYHSTTGDGRNAFSLSEADRDHGRANATFEDTRYLSQLGEHFLAGVLDGIPDVMPMELVPTINGYKRLVGASIRIISPPSFPPSATHAGHYQTTQAHNAPISTYQSYPARKEVISPPSSLEDVTNAMMRPDSIVL